MGEVPAERLAWAGDDAPAAAADDMMHTNSTFPRSGPLRQAGGAAF
jgi:hypothetical protein